MTDFKFEALDFIELKGSVLLTNQWREIASSIANAKLQKWNGPVTGCLA